MKSVEKTGCHLAAEICLLADSGQMPKLILEAKCQTEKPFPEAIAVSSREANRTRNPTQTYASK
jgi:hypothetical protein